MNMARPIRETPILVGKDAERMNIYRFDSDIKYKVKPRDTHLLIARNPEVSSYLTISTFQPKFKALEIFSNCCFLVIVLEWVLRR